jgi:hypothetical protein
LKKENYFGITSLVLIALAILFYTDPALTGYVTADEIHHCKGIAPAVVPGIRIGPDTFTELPENPFVKGGSYPDYWHYEYGEYWWENDKGPCIWKCDKDYQAKAIKGTKPTCIIRPHECGTTPPTGPGVILGALRQDYNRKKEWRYIPNRWNEDPRFSGGGYAAYTHLQPGGSCTWTCELGYVREGNRCVLEDGSASLKAHFGFESSDIKNHVSPSDPSGELVGGELVEGVVGKAVLFDSDGDHVKIPDSDSLSVEGSMTISACVKIDSDFGLHPVVAKTKGLNPSPYGFYVEDLLSKFSSGDGKGSEISSKGKSPISKGEWHHLAVTLTDGGQVIHYLDGVESGKGLIVENTIDNDDSLYIGSRSDYVEDGSFGLVKPSFKGSLDELKIWDNVLRPEEIKSEYDSLCGCEVGCSEPEIIPECDCGEGEKCVDGICKQSKLLGLTLIHSKDKSFTLDSLVIGSGVSGKNWPKSAEYSALIGDREYFFDVSHVINFESFGEEEIINEEIYYDEVKKSLVLPYNDEDELKIKGGSEDLLIKIGDYWFDPCASCHYYEECVEGDCVNKDNCWDTDPDSSSDIQGKVFNDVKDENLDACKSSSVVMDYKCPFGVVEERECPAGSVCFDGDCVSCEGDKCNPKAFCNDPDGAYTGGTNDPKMFNPSERNFVNTEYGKVWDYCDSDTGLKEIWCGGSTISRLGDSCENGCKRGACL